MAALIKDFYRRIEQDDLLRVAFPHFRSDETTRFFLLIGNLGGWCY